MYGKGSKLQRVSALCKASGLQVVSIKKLRSAHLWKQGQALEDFPFTQISIRLQSPFLERDSDIICSHVRSVSGWASLATMTSAYTNELKDEEVTNCKQGLLCLEGKLLITRGKVIDS